jgi:hypothetical protein
MERYTPHTQFSNLLLKPICLVVGVYYSGLVPFLSCEGHTREVVNIWMLSRHTSVLVGGYCTMSLLVWLYCCIHEHNSLHVPCLHARAGAVVVVVGLLCAGSNVQMLSCVCVRERAGVVSFRHILQVQNNNISCHGCDSYMLSSLSCPVLCCPYLSFASFSLFCLYSPSILVAFSSFVSFMSRGTCHSRCPPWLSCGDGTKDRVVLMYGCWGARIELQNL